MPASSRPAPSPPPCERWSRPASRVFTFHEFGQNPDGDMVEAGRAHAAGFGVDAIIGFGGGSSLDCAKGINFLLTNGGTMADYRGYDKARTPLLPMIAVPTTAGTGSEAQSYCVISDPATHMKMACGDPSAAVRVAILDPELTLTAPHAVTAMAGYDAIAHAVETWVTTKRTTLSETFAWRAWDLLRGAFERVLTTPQDLDARSAMLVGAHFAGAAIEQSMLGAAHACSNPLTARYDLAHGLALSILLPHVVRWNASHVGARYARLVDGSKQRSGGDELAQLLERFAAAAGLGGRLRDQRRHRRGAAGARRARGPAVDRHVQPAAVRCRWRPRLVSVVVLGAPDFHGSDGTRLSCT